MRCTLLLLVALAMAAFLLTGAFAGWVLWRARVSFAIDADRVQEELSPYREDPAAYLLRAARGLHDAYLENEMLIERRETVFGFALFALGRDPTLGASAGVSMTTMSDQPASGPRSAPVRHDVGRMSVDVFMPENRLARARAEARKRAVKQWLHRLLKRSQDTQSVDLD